MFQGLVQSASTTLQAGPEGSFALSNPVCSFSLPGVFLVQHCNPSVPHPSRVQSKICRQLGVSFGFAVTWRSRETGNSVLCLDLLAGLGDWMGCWRSHPCWLLASQIPYPLCSLSSPSKHHFLSSIFPNTTRLHYPQAWFPKFLLILPLNQWGSRLCWQPCKYCKFRY